MLKNADDNEDPKEKVGPKLNKRQILFHESVCVGFLLNYHKGRILIQRWKMTSMEDSLNKN